MFPKAVKRLTSLTWKSRLMKIWLRRLELLMGVLKRVRCVCSTYVYLSGRGTHGNCVDGSCAFSRWLIRARASEFGVECLFLVCVSRNLEEFEISNSFIAVFRISRCLFRCFILTEIGYKTSFHLMLLWKQEENLISLLIYEVTFRS